MSPASDVDVEFPLGLVASWGAHDVQFHRPGDPVRVGGTMHQCVRVTDRSGCPPSRLIFHIAFDSDWRSAERSGEYRISTMGKRLEDVGFIHASFEHQIPTVAAAVYRDTSSPLVLLVIDPDRLDVPVVVENLEGGQENFPHIYGALPAHAVIEVRSLKGTDPT